MRNWGLIRVVSVVISISLLLCGCSGANKQPVVKIEDFEEADIRGWSMSEDASYPLSTLTGISGALLKNGARYLATGDLKKAYRVEDSVLYISRYYSAMETEGYLRGLFITNDSMRAASGREVSARITVNAGFVAGICVGTDDRLSNGFAAVVNLAKKRIEVMRVNSGILTSLEKYQTGVYSSSVDVEGGMSCKLSVRYEDKGNNAYGITVSVDGTEVLDTVIKDQGVKEGRGDKVSIVASDMDCEFSDIACEEEVILEESKLASVPEAPMVTDETFRGDIVSAPFKITSDYIALKIGGTKSDDNLNVRLVDEKSGEVLYSETGSGSEEMTRRLWDVKKFRGSKCRIIVSDRSRVGHLNVDDIFLTDIIPPDAKYSILNSQIGYGTDSVKKAYLRAPLSVGEDISGAAFTVNKFETGEKVYEGRVKKLGAYWESNWWEMDFTDMTAEGNFVVAVFHRGMSIVSTRFVIGERALVRSSLVNTSLNQLDLRRSPNKLGWRDSSTDDLREVHAQAMVVHTMVDLLEKQGDWLTEYDRARVIDNIKFGIAYLLAAQELTDDPKTNGRFVHDLYPSQFSAHRLRTWFDTVYAMTALARAYPVLKGCDAGLAKTVKKAYDVSFDMCSLRPYYLPEEFNVEGSGGLDSVTSAMRFFYYIRQMNWNYDLQLRTRDRLMFMYACTLMAKADGDAKYIEQAKKMARLVSGRQFTDYTNPIDGAYGCFYEFDNTDEGIMLEWIQSPNMLLGNQTPTDMQPYIDLLCLLPGDDDAAMWYNTLKIYADGYVKRASKLSPLGIYPVAAYKNEKHGGIKFFQTLSHGATSHFGLSGRNIMALALFFSDPELQRLAENNVQFVAGLNPGFPTSAENLNWKPHSLLYLIGSRYFKGNFNNASYVPPIGSGFNGFSASKQFSPVTIADAKDMPAGILDENGNWQFNEDYIPHGVGYSSGAAAVESPVTVEVKTLSGGRPVEAQVRVTSPVERTVKTGASGELTIKDVGAGEKLRLELTYKGHTIIRETTPVAGSNPAVTVDFERDADASLTVPQELSGKSSAQFAVVNTGSAKASFKVKFMADGAVTDIKQQAFELEPGESKTLTIGLESEGRVKPYLVYAYLLVEDTPFVVTASGLAS